MRPRGCPDGQGLTSHACSPEGRMCVAPDFMPTAAPAGGRCPVGTNVSCVSVAPFRRWGAQAGDTGAVLLLTASKSSLV